MKFTTEERLKKQSDLENILKDVFPSNTFSLLKELIQDYQKPDYKVIRFIVSQSGDGNSTIIQDLNSIVKGRTYTINEFRYGRVKSVELLQGGSGYSNDENIYITGNSSGEGATVNITTTGGKVTSVEVSDYGIAYTVGEILTISGGNGNALVRISEVSSDDFTNSGAKENVVGQKFIYNGVEPKWDNGSPLETVDGVAVVTIIEIYVIPNN